jgi:UDP-3-O-[3-hydroxymyristoyl] glucosamine N-acyltransferase
MAFTISQIAKELGGEVTGDGSIEIKGFAPAESARAGDLTFAENESYFVQAEGSAASAILVSGDVASASKTLIRVPHARIAFAKVLPLFFPERKFTPGMHPSAVVAPSAQIDPTAHVGPHCVVEERTILGAGVVLQGGNHVGLDCRIGDGSHLFPNAVVYARTQIGKRVRIHAGAVIGADGFGYVFDHGIHRKVPQIGNVIIEDDVEIGANAAIDRGALGSTVIRRGTKIDNLVQIGHNAIIGEHCILCGLVGIAGSTKVGNYVTMAGQVGVAGHLTIGNQVTLGAQSGVMRNVPDGEKWFWTPAQPDRQIKRILIALQKLPELFRRVSALEKTKGASNSDSA